MIKTIQILLLSIICFISCNYKSENTSTEKAQVVNESTKLQMFNLAFMQEGTAPYYVVATIKNKNTDEVKEVCTESISFKGALSREFKLDYNNIFSSDIAVTRYYEFSNDSALWNISFDLYTDNELQIYSKTLSIDSIIDVLKDKKYSYIQFEPRNDNYKEQTMFAHIMFDNGVMVRRGCETASFCSMVLFDSTKAGVNYEGIDWDYY